MRSFLDTSVLIAAFQTFHQHHAPSFELLRRSRPGESACGVHSLAEVYSTLTSMPPPYRVSGDQAMLFIGGLPERLSVVGLDRREYLRVLEESAAAGVAGGAVYDALLGACAVKAGTRVLYTWNVRDFLRLSAAISERVRRPGE